MVIAPATPRRPATAWTRIWPSEASTTTVAAAAVPAPARAVARAEVRAVAGMAASGRRRARRRPSQRPASACRRTTCTAWPWPIRGRRRWRRTTSRWPTPPSAYLTPTWTPTATRLPATESDTTASASMRSIYPFRQWSQWSTTRRRSTAPSTTIPTRTVPRITATTICSNSSSTKSSSSNSSTRSSSNNTKFSSSKSSSSNSSSSINSRCTVATAATVATRYTLITVATVTTTTPATTTAYPAWRWPAPRPVTDTRTWRSTAPGRTRWRWAPSPPASPPAGRRPPFTAAFPYGGHSVVSGVLRDQCQVNGMLSLAGLGAGHPAHQGVGVGNNVNHTGAQQQPNVPTYKWMQVKRNVPKPGKKTASNPYLLAPTTIIILPIQSVNHFFNDFPIVTLSTS